MTRSPAGPTAALLLVLAACGACADRAPSLADAERSGTATPSGHCSRSVDRLADAVTHPHGGDENTYPDGFAGLVVDQRHHAMRMWWKGAVPASTAATLAAVPCIHVELHEDATFSMQEMSRADDRLVGSRELIAGTRITAAEPSSDGSGVTLLYEDDDVPAEQVVKAAEALTGVRVLSAQPGGPVPS